MPELAVLALIGLVVGAVGVGLGILLAPRVARLVPHEEGETAGGAGGGDDGEGDR